MKKTGRFDLPLIHSLVNQYHQEHQEPISDCLTTNNNLLSSPTTENQCQLSSVDSNSSENINQENQDDLLPTDNKQINNTENKDHAINLEAEILEDDPQLKGHFNCTEKINQNQQKNSPISHQQIERIILELQLQETAQYLAKPTKQKPNNLFLGQIEQQLNNLINRKI